MTGILTVKLGRDLLATWSRLALMVIAISVSLTVFGAVLFAWAAMGREVRNAYSGTEPASTTILLDKGIDAEQMAAIAVRVRILPRVIEATGRTQFTGDVEVNSMQRDDPLQVFVAAPDDPLRMARFYVQQRSWPPAPAEIFIPRDSLTLLNVAVGDTVTVQEPDGERLTLRVTGTVYDPSLSPSAQEQTGRAYLSTASLAAPGRPALLDQLKIQVPEPYKHLHQWQANSLLLSLLAGGAAALLLSTILVANVLSTLFTQQIPQIGIMKAIGGRAGTSRVSTLP